jgi:hypothetical protein
LITLKLKVGDFRERIEIPAAHHRPFGVLTQYVPWVVSVHVIGNKLQAPLEGTHEAVVISLVMCAFAPVHECFPQNSNTSVNAQFNEPAILKA